jgi:hypothetical protein
MVFGRWPVVARQRHEPTPPSVPYLFSWKGNRAEPWLEGAYALRQRLSAGIGVYEALRLSQAA